MSPHQSNHSVLKRLSINRRKSVAQRIERLEKFLNSRLRTHPTLKKEDVIGCSDRDIVHRFLPRFFDEPMNENNFNDRGYLRRDTDNNLPLNSAQTAQLELQPTSHEAVSSDQLIIEADPASDLQSSVDADPVSAPHQSTPWSTPRSTPTLVDIDRSNEPKTKSKRHKSSKSRHFMRYVPHLQLKFIDQEIALLVDSGAQVNLIKECILPGDIVMNVDEAMELKGIAEDTLQSIGTVTIQLFRFYVKFHVIQVWPEFPLDGIIGANFLASSESVINFGLSQIEIGGRKLSFKRGKPAYTQTDAVYWFGNPMLLLDPLLYLNCRKENNELMGQFLIDTGAECNVIKKGLADELGKISQKHKSLLQGVSGKLYLSLGTVDIPILGQKVTFQVVPDEFSIPAEGILGGQYFRKNFVTINFPSKVMRIGERCIPLSSRISLFERPPQFNPNHRVLLREVLSNQTNLVMTLM